MSLSIDLYKIYLNNSQFLKQAVLSAAFGKNWATDVWIGLNDERGFHWTDQSEVDYVNWAKGEPNGVAADPGVGQ